MDEQARRKPRIQFGGRTASERVQLKAHATMALANAADRSACTARRQPSAFFFRTGPRKPLISPDSGKRIETRGRISKALGRHLALFGSLGTENGRKSEGIDRAPVACHPRGGGGPGAWIPECAGMTGQRFAIHLESAPR